MFFRCHSNIDTAHSVGEWAPKTLGFNAWSRKGMTIYVLSILNIIEREKERERDRERERENLRWPHSGSCVGWMGWIHTQHKDLVVVVVVVIVVVKFKFPNKTHRTQQEYLLQYLYNACAHDAQGWVTIQWHTKNPHLLCLGVPDIMEAYRAGNSSRNIKTLVWMKQWQTILLASIMPSPSSPQSWDSVTLAMNPWLKNVSVTYIIHHNAQTYSKYIECKSLPVMQIYGW